MLRTALLLVFLRLALGAICQSVPVDQLAPDSTTIYRFELHEGALVIGRIVAADRDTVHVASGSFGRHALARSSIARATLYEEGSNRFGRKWFDAPVPSRNLIGATAIPMKPREFRFTNTYLLFNSLSAGVTKNITASAGFETTSLLSDSSAGGIYFGSVKYGRQMGDGIHVAAQGQVLSVPFGGWVYSGSQRLNLGFLGGLVTLGDANRQLTLGLSWSVLDFRWLTRYPMITLAGQWRFGKRMGVVSENWLLPIPGSRSPYLISYALRVMGTRICADFGFLNNEGITQVIAPGIPFASFSVRW
ncbi:MAG TPA: hypothetical protein PKY96_14895 [Flavobacteriales bacterium]|nr:hypothetical protein [Flavobacteriales bacterium]